MSIYRCNQSFPPFKSVSKRIGDFGKIPDFEFFFSKTHLVVAETRHTRSWYTADI
jgi:hypothetical protein